jgi:hypothetical protein
VCVAQVTSFRHIWGDLKHFPAVRGDDTNFVAVGVINRVAESGTLTAVARLIFVVGVTFVPMAFGADMLDMSLVAHMAGNPKKVGVIPPLKGYRRPSASAAARASV